MPPISVLLIESSALFLRGLRSYLEEEPDMQVIGTALCGEDALMQAARLQPQVAVVDLRLKWSLRDAEPAQISGWRLAAALGNLPPPPQYSFSPVRWNPSGWSGWRRPACAAAWARKMIRHPSL